MHEGSATSFLTVSIGAAFCSRHQPVTATAFFDFADRALYTAKANGRNCVVVRHMSDGARERRAPALAP
jgi:PleD family two-component response regulator